MDTQAIAAKLTKRLHISWSERFDHYFVSSTTSEFSNCFLVSPEKVRQLRPGRARRGKLVGSHGRAKAEGVKDSWVLTRNTII